MNLRDEINEVQKESRKKRQVHNGKKGARTGQ